MSERLRTQILDATRSTARSTDPFTLLREIGLTLWIEKFGKIAIANEIYLAELDATLSALENNISVADIRDQYTEKMMTAALSETGGLIGAIQQIRIEIYARILCLLNQEIKAIAETNR